MAETAMLVGSLISAGTQYMSYKDTKKAQKKQEDQAEMAEKRAAMDAKKAEKEEIAQGRMEAERKNQRLKAYTTKKQSLLQNSGVDPYQLGA